MQIAIIEDESLAADALEVMLNELRPNAKISAKLCCVEDAVEWLELNEHPDLIFCDIHLSDGNSFEIFKEVEVKCPVIFSTAYDQYAIEAFRVNSIDYLLKPLNPKEVAKALRKYEDYFRNNGSSQMENLQNLLQQSPSSKNAQFHKSRYMVKIGDTMKPVAVDDIAYFMAEDGVVFLVNFSGKRYIVNYTLDQLEDQLDPTLFFRANRQLVINIKSVNEVKPYFKGRLLLYLKPEIDQDVVVSSGKSATFKDWLDL